ncbi:hypothetical protein HZB89_01575, partial [archaeon]|nr:hypothetical protein [archaeon]
SGLKISSIVNWLKANESGVGVSQLYSNYLSAFIRAGLIAKRKYSAYGLKSGSLNATLKDIELELKKEFGKVLDHAVKLELILLP